jgi:uncharacterized protein
VSTPSNSPPKHTNRLARSMSPYLLQHAHNPVDWYPWGAEAIEAARRLDRPIFLSVGYSTCYWCHVMERQSFENEQIAALMNDRFVCVKVDREERPDVDALYMTAVQILTRQGGWPMSVFLTPDLKPFFGGTYFPPEDSYGRPGFPRVLASISATYNNKREQVERSADEIVRMLQQVAEPRQLSEPLTVDLSWVESLIERSTQDYEQCYGGFGDAPKFPRETLLELVLAYAGSPQATEDATGLREQVLYTLDFMADGGIRDQLGGGFHRYSTDEKWLVPHFEIMLYDQAMLAVVYVEAWRQTKVERYATVARGICDFVMREMTGPGGEIYTAIDAEVDGQEGLNYLWTAEEVEGVLSGGEEPAAEAASPQFGRGDVELFLQVYGLSAGPNFADPHHGSGTPDKNILHLPTPLADVAKGLGVTEAELDARLAPMRRVLKAHRDRRKQPLLDTKVLTSWNALMIRAFAVTGQALNEPRYLAAAEAGARFLLSNHWKGETLIRTSRPDVGDALPIAGFLDDYAFTVQALLAVSQATHAGSFELWARKLCEQMKAKFLDAELGGFYSTPADASDLIVRQKSATDSPLPSGNAVAALALLELGEADAARKVVAEFARQLDDYAEGMSSLVQAAFRLVERAGPFTVSPRAEEAAGVEQPLSPERLAHAAVELSAAWESPTDLRVTLRVLDGFHVNANRAAEGMIPTTLALAGPRGAAIAAAIDYPPGEERKFAFATEAVRVYAGEVTIAARLDAPPTPGTPVKAVLTYQPCTDEACLSAVSKTVEVAAA